MAVHVPAAWRHQGRPVQVAEPKDIEIFVTSTRAEYESIAGDHTAYRYTARETKLTGLPRFDRLAREGNRFPPEKRDLILIAPTWRSGWPAAAPGQAVGRSRRIRLVGVRDEVARRDPVPELASSPHARTQPSAPVAPEPAATPRRSICRPRASVFVRGPGHSGVVRPGPRTRYRLLVDVLQRRLHRAAGRLLPVRPDRVSVAGTSGGAGTSTTSATGSGRSRRPATRRWPASARR